MPYLIFGVTCVVGLVADLAFKRELIQKDHEGGSMWDRRLWAYLRRYDDRSLEIKRFLAITTMAACIASFVWLATSNAW